MRFPTYDHAGRASLLRGMRPGRPASYLSRMQHKSWPGRDDAAHCGRRIPPAVARTFLSHFILPLVVALPWLAPLPSSAAPPLTFLHSRGQDIVNENGDKVLLRGVGLGNWLLPEGYMWKFGDMGDRPRKIEKIVSDLIGPEDARRFWPEYRKNYITEADIKRIAELGYNSVRPALNSRLFLAADGAPDESAEGFQLLDHLVAWGRANGVYVIIDMHRS